jgi:hypothetical protein
MASALEKPSPYCDEKLLDQAVPGERAGLEI